MATTAEAADAVANKLMEYQSRLDDYPSGGVVIDDPEIMAHRAANPQRDEVFDPISDAGLLLGETWVRAYYPEYVVTSQFLEGLREWVSRLGEFGLEPGSGTVRIREVCEQDWANAWKAYYHPEKIGARLVIKPSWESYNPEQGDIVIELDPGMAFGTGTHPTTVLCLEGLERYVSSGDVVFDIGTGSGILAIAAAKLGAASVTAVDIDPVAVSAALENIRLNHVCASVSVRQGTVGEISGQADVVVANIIASVLVDIAQPVAQRVKPRGIVLASGIIKDRCEEVEKAFTAAGLVISERMQKGEWVCLVAKRER